MIPLLAFMGAPKWLKWGGIAFVLIAIIGAGLYVRHQIYHEGFRAAQEACERERRAQEEANNAAIRKAEEDLFKAADRLSLKSKEYADALKALDAASAADPDSGNCGLSDRSVQRLQAIQ